MKILLVDDHSLLRDGVTALLRQGRPDAMVLACGDGAAALDIAARESDLDAVILDLALPEVDGVAVLKQLGALRPDLPVVVLSASDAPADVRRAMAAGALGYVPKSANPRTLLSALNMVLDGELYVPAIMLQEEVQVEISTPKFTPRQLDVLRCMCDGLSNKNTARQLDMAEKTVKAHVTAILRALGATNRTQAATVARKMGLAT
ncbi:MAG TPA: response regulator transcription factor [Caulobacterales bacterium]|nr:response regulator transcription factor [Caulobacterales bacterium]